MIDNIEVCFSSSNYGVVINIVNNKSTPKFLTAHNSQIEMPVNTFILKEDLEKLNLSNSAYTDYIKDFCNKKICRKKSGKEFNKIAKSILAVKNYHTAIYSILYPFKEYLMYNVDPKINKLMLTQYMFKKMIISKWAHNPAKLEDINNLDFYSENKHRIQIKCMCERVPDMTRHAESVIYTAENINGDFLTNIKYFLTPSIVGLITQIPNIDYNLSRSHIIALSHAVRTDKNKFDKLINIKSSEFIKLKKDIENKTKEKIDLRKSKNIQKMVLLME